MAQNGIDPKNALFIGDTDHDVETADAVGAPCVLLAGGHQSFEVLSRCGVPVFRTAAELSAALEF